MSIGIALMLGCPHGRNSSPTTCSQCLGVVPRRVVYDSALERLTVDGIPVEIPSGFTRPTPIIKSPRKPISCSLCGKLGHNRLKCTPEDRESTVVPDNQEIN